MLQRTEPLSAVHTEPAAGRAGEPFRLLIPREREVVSLVAAGGSNREIAQRLSIAERTVQAHLTSVFEKLGVSSRPKLAIYLISWEIPGSYQSSIDGVKRPW